MPRALASTITRGSWAAAASIAASSSPGASTRAIPTDEPSRAGLTQHG